MVTYTEGNSLRIYVSGAGYPNHYIDCWANRWDYNDYDIIVETFMSSGARDFLFSNIIPGSIREYRNILGKTIQLDGTFESGNTLILEPISGYGLSSLRSRKKVYVHHAKDWFVSPNKFGIRLDCKEDRDWDIL